jgi:histidinol-phosphate aminotransferase
MLNYAQKHIQKIKPYCPPLSGRGQYSGLLLDFNERTIPISNKVKKVLVDFFKNGKINTYPDYGNLSKKIAKYANVTEAEVMLTNGSEQAMDIIFRTFTAKDSETIIPSPSYSMFYLFGELCENNIICPDYEANFTYPVNEVLKKINKKTKLIVICNPNNPSGTLVSLNKIESILKKALAVKAIVYLDEAYFEFSQITAAPLINKYPNLIISRTFSKAFGLASLRIGYILTSTQNITELLKVRGPYDINMPACLAANAALDDIKDIKNYVSEVMFKAKPLFESFLTQNKITFYKSGANFILFKPKNVQKTFDILNKKGFLLRRQMRKGLEDTIRLTIGTEKQIKTLISAYKKYLL